MQRFSLAAGLLLALNLSLPAQEPADEAARDDEKILKASGLGADPQALLRYFKDKTFAEIDPKELSRLLRELGSSDFRTREDAFIHLAKLGTAALAALKQAEGETDPEVKRRVAELKRRIEIKAEALLQGAALRTIARGKPAGAAAILLAYAPFASEPSIVDEIGKALGSVAQPGGKVDAAVLEALGSDKALLRGLAGEALARAGATERLPAVRQLLKDADANVRLRVALALVTAKEDQAVPVLVELLGQLNADQLWRAEELLVRLAGDKAPAVALGSDQATRQAARAAWQGWLQAQDKIDLAKLEEAPPLLGFTLMVQQHFNRPGIVVPGKARTGGEVFEIDQNKTVKWRFDVETYPVDAAIVGNDRVLVAEYQAACITERSFKGQVLWKKEVNGNPIGIQRLPSGNTFIVMQNRLLEIDRDQNEVWSLPRQQHDIMRGRKLRNGEVIFITNLGVLTRLNPKTKEEKSFNVGQVQVLFGSIDVLPNGHVLLPEFHTNRVVEYDTNGKAVNHINVQWPNSAVRLPNGHTLVASQNARRVIEFNRSGEEVWSYQCDGAVFNAHRR
jgi:HEAT repeat protein